MISKYLRPISSSLGDKTIAASSLVIYALMGLLECGAAHLALVFLSMVPIYTAQAE